MKVLTRADKVLNKQEIMERFNLTYAALWHILGIPEFAALLRPKKYRKGSFVFTLDVLPENNIKEFSKLLVKNSKIIHALRGFK